MKHSLCIRPISGVEAASSRSRRLKRPICMNWDRMLRPTVDCGEPVRLSRTVWQAGGRKGERTSIVICEDTDGARHRGQVHRVRQDKLSIPTSFVLANGGIIVTQGRRTRCSCRVGPKGDDVADERKILFTGWGTGDTHAGPSNLRYGFRTAGSVRHRRLLRLQWHRFGGERHKFQPGLLPIQI